MSLFSPLLRSKSYPLNKIYISKDKLLSNYTYLSELQAGVRVAPVLKSNAYGHGIQLVGQILDQKNPPFICVDSLYEAYQLKKAGVKSEILIMGYIDPRSLNGRKLPFSYVVFDLDQLRAINEYQPGAKVHLFFDTGMHREGFDTKDLKNLIRRLKPFSKVRIDGIMSHLAVPDKPDDPVTKLQLTNFRAAKLMILQQGYQPTWFHLGGSFGLLNGLTKECNVMRVGLSLFGYPTALSRTNSKLLPVLKMTSRIAQWKYVSKGEFIGYAKGFQAKSDMVIAVLPIGYNDGVDKRLSNKGEVFCKPVGLDDFGDKRSKVYDKLPHRVSCQVIGEISMNITTIELSNAKKELGSKLPAVGDEVEIFSDDPLSPNSIENAAKLCSTTPYELLVHLNPTTKREEV